MGLGSRSFWSREPEARVVRKPEAGVLLVTGAMLIVVGFLMIINLFVKP